MHAIVGGGVIGLVVVLLMWIYEAFVKKMVGGAA